MDAQKVFSKPFVLVLTAVFCCLLWGSAFPAIKTGYLLFEIDGADHGSQILFAGLRFSLAGVLVIAFESARRRKFLLPARGDLPAIGILSLAQTSLHYIFFYLGLSMTAGTKSSVLTASTVFVALIFACFLFRTEKFSLLKLLGCLVGFGGVVLINLDGNYASFGWGDGFILIAAAFGALSSVLIKIFSQKSDPVLLSGYQFFLGGVTMIAVGFALGGRLNVFPWDGALLLVYLAFVSAAAYTLWGILLKYNPVTRVTVFNFLDPVAGFALSAIFLREEIDWLFGVLALLLVSGGILILHFAGVRPEKQKETE